MDREQIVRRILEMRAAGESYPDIARKLQAEGIPTLSGRGEWRKQTVHKIVQKAPAVELEKVGKLRKPAPTKLEKVGKSQISVRPKALETELAEALRGKSEAEKQAGEIEAENARLKVEIMGIKRLEKVGKSEIARLSGLEAENAELREKLKKAGGNPPYLLPKSGSVSGRSRPSAGRILRSGIKFQSWKSWLNRRTINSLNYFRTFRST